MCISDFLENKIAPKRRLPTIDYTVDQAIRDANSYHMRCSFYQGVVVLTKEVKGEPMTREEILAEIARLDEEMTKLETKFVGPSRSSDAKVRSDAEFMWTVYSARKKQLAALLVDRRTPGRTAPKENASAADESEDSAGGAEASGAESTTVSPAPAPPPPAPE